MKPTLTFKLELLTANPCRKDLTEALKQIIQALETRDSWSGLTGNGPFTGRWEVE